MSYRLRRRLCLTWALVSVVLCGACASSAGDDSSPASGTATVVVPGDDGLSGGPGAAGDPASGAATGVTGSASPSAAAVSPSGVGSPSGATGADEPSVDDGFGGDTAGAGGDPATGADDGGGGSAGDGDSAAPDVMPATGAGGEASDGSELPVGGEASGGAGGVGAEMADAPVGLLWPIDCVPGDTCYEMGYPDVDGDNQAFNCEPPGYEAHEGTDIPISWERMDAGVDVYAAAAGEVLWAFDGKYDRCPDDTEPDCQRADYEAESSAGNLACTPLGPYCGTGTGNCFWCFEGGNVIVIRHQGVPGVFATRYDHLRQGSVLVSSGDVVMAGQKIAEVGSAGNSSGPHLHFEVWGTGFYELTEPWVGPCGPNTDQPLWAFDPPWESFLQ